MTGGRVTGDYSARDVWETTLFFSEILGDKSDQPFFIVIELMALFHNDAGVDAEGLLKGNRNKQVGVKQCLPGKDGGGYPLLDKIFYCMQLW